MKGLVEMKHKTNKKGNILIETFDTLFIMILCFATLLTAMLMKGEVTGEMEYCVNYTTVIITLLGLVIYLSFILTQSDKGLKSMIQKLYGKSEDRK